MLNQNTIETIQSTIPLLEQHEQQITNHFYDSLFTEHPYLKNIFNMANQASGDQSRALGNAIIAYAKNIENIPALLPVVQGISHKHASFGIQKQHYNVVGETLLKSISEVLGIPSDHPAISAWAEAYGVLAKVFIDVEQSIYTENKQREGGWEGFRDFYISDIKVETPEVKSFYLSPLGLGETPKFKAGQYVGVKTSNAENQTQQIRQYSLSKSDQFRISVKAEKSGLISNSMHSKEIGDTVALQAPTGVFTLQQDQPKYVFLAGGVGITPLFCMLESLLEKGVSDHDILFIQCAKDQQHAIFKGDIENFVTTHQISHKTSYENSSNGDYQGYLTREVIASWLSSCNFSKTDTEVYFCGPKPFMSALNQHFLALGFNEESINYEIFGPNSSL